MWRKTSIILFLKGRQLQCRAVRLTCSGHRARRNQGADQGLLMSKPSHLTLGNTASLDMCYIPQPLSNFQKQFTSFIYFFLLLILERKGKR